MCCTYSIALSLNDSGISSILILGQRNGGVPKCNVCERKAYDHNIHSNERYIILFIKRVTTVLSNLSFIDKTMIIKFKRLYSAVKIGHLKSHI